MVGTRTVGGRVAAVAVVALSSVFLPSCAAGSAETAPAPSTSAAGTVVARSDRAVPAPVDGALRAHLPAPGDASDEGVSLLFGDSVAVLLADELARELSGGLYVDGVDCRRLDVAFTGPCGGVPVGTAVPTGLDALHEVVAELDDEGTVIDAAVLVIANNAALRADDLDAAMDVLASVPRVWWVTTDVEGRAWRDPNNAALADLAERHPRAGVIDWFAAARDRDWRSDHVHPDDAGQSAMAALVAEHLRCDCVP